MFKSIGQVLALVFMVTATPVWAYSSDQDPFEPFNRAVFNFNDTLDGWVVKPVAQGYARFMPRPAQKLVSNFFDNLSEPRNIINDLLQGDFRQAGNDSGRFVVNSTIGMLGMLDVATEWGMTQSYNDFGLTLGRWGAPGDSYVVLPFAGPYTVRGVIGFYPDAYSWPPTWSLRGYDYWATVAVWGIQKRAGLLKQEDLIIGDKYTFIRDAFLQHRHYLLTGEVAEDDF